MKYPAKTVIPFLVVGLILTSPAEAVKLKDIKRKLGGDLGTIVAAALGDEEGKAKFKQQVDAALHKQAGTAAAIVDEAAARRAEEEAARKAHEDEVKRLEEAAAKAREDRIRREEEDAVLAERLAAAQRALAEEATAHDIHTATIASMVAQLAAVEALLPTPIGTAASLAAAGGAGRTDDADSGDKGIKPAVAAPSTLEGSADAMSGDDHLRKLQAAMLTSIEEAAARTNAPPPAHSTIVQAVAVAVADPDPVGDDPATVTTASIHGLSAATDSAVDPATTVTTDPATAIIRAQAAELEALRAQIALLITAGTPAAAPAPAPDDALTHDPGLPAPARSTPAISESGIEDN